jgi:guanidinobutyrase
MISSKKLFVLLGALIPIWIVFGQDFTPSVFDRNNGIIPLNSSDPTYDVWSQLRDPANDPDREAGPFYPGRLRNSGVQTFFGLPIAINPEDLIAGEVDVAILGAPLDMGVGMRGTAFGPGAIRESMGVGGGGGLPHMHTGVSWKRELKAVDYGNSPIDRFSVERSMQPVRELVREIASTGAIPIVIGGDHSHVLGQNYIQVGLRGYWPGEEGFEWMRENNFRYHTMVEIERDGWDVVTERILAEANDGPEYLYISLDIDVLDPAYASGTGTPEPGGLTTRELYPLIRGLCTENNLVGFELVEVNPLVDPGYTTVMNANRAVQECLTGIAMRKTGITDGAYLNPLTVEDAVPDP